MWHGIYQWFSRKYCQGYLNEFCFRYNHRRLKLVEKFQALFSLIISKKSDLEKGYYVIEQKPKQTITYEIKCSINTPFYLRPVTIKRTVYVAKTEEEKKMYEEIIEKKRFEIRTRGERL